MARLFVTQKRTEGSVHLQGRAVMKIQTHAAQMQVVAGSGPKDLQQRAEQGGQVARQVLDRGRAQNEDFEPRVLKVELLVIYEL